MCRELLSRIIRDQSGVAAIEYALLAALISVGAIGVLTELGDSMISMFEIVTDANPVKGKCCD